LRLNIFHGLASLGLTIAAPAGAATVIDQNAVIMPAGIGTAQITAGVRSFGGQIRDIKYVQTITAGLNGSLDRVEFQGFRSTFNQPADTLRLTLIDGDYAAGARTAVGSQDLNAANLSVFGNVRYGESLATFSTAGLNYSVTAGKVFSILVEVLPLNQLGTVSFITGNVMGQEQLPNGFFRTIVEGANYTRGSLYQLSPSGSIVAPISQDIGFRSFVNVSAAVPEPATWAMLILGFGVVGATLRRRPRLNALAA
jgi:hypothetical protein